MHRATRKQRSGSFAVRRRCSSSSEEAVGEGELNAAIKGRAVCWDWEEEEGWKGRRRAGGRRRRRPMMPWRVSDGILLTSHPALHPTLSLLFLCCPLAGLRLPKPPFSLLAAMSIPLSLSRLWRSLFRPPYAAAPPACALHALCASFSSLQRSAISENRCPFRPWDQYPTAQLQCLLHD